MYRAHHFEHQAKERCYRRRPRAEPGVNAFPVTKTSMTCKMTQRLARHHWHESAHWDHLSRRQSRIAPSKSTHGTLTTLSSWMRRPRGIACVVGTAVIEDGLLAVTVGGLGSPDARLALAGRNAVPRRANSLPDHARSVAERWPTRSPIRGARSVRHERCGTAWLERLLTGKRTTASLTSCIEGG